MGKLLNRIFDITFDWWLKGIQLLFIWLFIALFIPGLNWFDHVYMLVTYLMGYPAEYMFTFFNDYSDHVLATWNPNANPIEDGVNIMLFTLALVSAFFFPVVFLSCWLVIAFLAIVLFFPSIMKAMHYWTPEAENNWHLLSGHTTVQDTFDAEVQANAIASALNKHRR